MTLPKPNRKTQKDLKTSQPDPAAQSATRRTRYLLGLVVGLIGLTILGLLLSNQKQGNPAKIELPPLRIVEIEGKTNAQTDALALAKFIEQHHLPEIPNFSQLSVRTAQDIHHALQPIAARPIDADAWGQLGRVFHSHEYSAKALECYSQASVLAPNDFQWPYYQGRIHADAFEYEPAIEAYNRSAELNTDYAPTFLALGNAYAQLGKNRQAKQAYQRFVTLRPTSSHGYFGLAQIAFDEENYPVAIELLSRVVAGHPRDFRAHNLLGQIYQRIGFTEKASFHLAQLKNLDQQDQITKHVFYDDPLYHQVLSSNTTDAAISERLRAAMKFKQEEVAIRLALELCKRHPDDAARMHSLSVAYKLSKQFQQALIHAEKAISLDEDLLEAHLTRAQILMILRRNEEALKLLEWVVTQDPDSFEGQYYRGTALVLSKQYRSAVEAFQQSIRINGVSARAHVALAEALNQTNQSAEAMKEYRRALDLDPTNSRAIQKLRANQP